MRCDGEGRFPRTRESENVTFRLGLPRLRGRWPAGPERAKKATKKRPLAQALLV